MSKVCPKCNRQFPDSSSFCPECGVQLVSVSNNSYANMPNYVKQKNMFDYIKICFRKYCDFSGRARRSEFWFFVLFNYIVSFVISVVSGIIGGIAGVIIGALNEDFTAIAIYFYVIYLILCGIYGLAVLLPGLAVAVRRLHDIGKSGWNYLIGLIPLVGPILVIVWYCQDSQPGENKWGANPKEI